MAKRGPNFLQNFIYNSVKENVVKATKVSTYHKNALTAAVLTDAFYAPLLADFLPVHNSLLAFKSEKGTDIGQRIGDTSSLDDLLESLRTDKIEAWEPAVRAIYNKRTNAYKAIFPAGREVFTTGKKDMIIEAVNQLSQALLSYPALSAVQADVAAFYLLLTGARGAQEGKKEEVRDDRGDVNTAIYNMCVIHFKNYGLIISHTPEDMDKIASLIDIQTIQKPATPKHTTGVVSAETLKKIWNRKWKAGMKLKLTSLDMTPIRFFLSDKPKKDYPGAGLNFQGSSAIVPIENLGPLTFKYLLVMNQSSNAGHYEVEIVD